MHCTASGCYDFLRPKWEVTKLPLQQIKLDYIVFLLCKELSLNSLKHNIYYFTVFDGQESCSGLAGWFQFMSCGCSHLKAARVSSQHGRWLSPHSKWSKKERQEPQCLPQPALKPNIALLRRRTQWVTSRRQGSLEAIGGRLPRSCNMLVWFCCLTLLHIRASNSIMLSIPLKLCKC